MLYIFRLRLTKLSKCCRPTNTNQSYPRTDNIYAKLIELLIMCYICDTVLYTAVVKPYDWLTMEQGEQNCNCRPLWQS